MQADPIRAPARAQDLILRHRVADYRAGDLEREYEALDIEEDHLFVYGFLPHRNWRLLHPRSFDEELSELERQVVLAFEAEGSLESRTLEERFGAGRGMNPWGSYSRATQLALDHLHHRGLLRVVRRERGNRVYELAPAAVEALPATDRLRELALVVANLLAPLPKTTFSHVVTRIRHSMRTAEVTATAIVKSIIEDGLLVEAKVDDVSYLLLPGQHVVEPRDEVRFLAPFDPLVWDRLRFEHLWGWPYRFEAYTPAAKRTRGYYAMPLLWRDALVGWVNVSAKKDTGLDVELGFVEGRPKEKAFERELTAEVERLRVFLQPRPKSGNAQEGRPSGSGQRSGT